MLKEKGEDDVILIGKQYAIVLKNNGCMIAKLKYKEIKLALL